jgi:hypothetical protein
MDEQHRPAFTGLRTLREHVVEFPLARVGVGESVTVRATVPRMFRPQRLIIARMASFSKGSGDLVVTSVKFGGNEVMPRAIRSLPAGLFAPESVAFRLAFGTALPGCEIAITLKDESRWSLRRLLRQFFGRTRRMKVFLAGMEVMAADFRGGVVLWFTATPMRTDGQSLGKLSPFGKN